MPFSIYGYLRLDKNQLKHPSMLLLVNDHLHLPQQFVYESISRFVLASEQSSLPLKSSFLNTVVFMICRILYLSPVDVYVSSSASLRCVLCVIFIKHPVLNKV
jgi:hypothetical protein